ncbi:MAG: ATP-dependent helicase HrpB, partial [Desulfuromonadales bacterium]|nr:ATP-dependent helicase HrpB [Desulfuromonadales bacterium]
AVAELAVPLPWQREVDWDGERLVAREVKRLGALALVSRPTVAEPQERVSALLALLRREGLERLGWSPAARQFAARVRFLQAVFPEQEWPDCSTEGLLGSLESWLSPHVAAVKGRTGLGRLDPLEPLQQRLSWQQRRQLEELAPTHLEVPSGHRIPLDYEVAEPPVLAVKLQELFGLAETPRVAAGRVPVVLHLLSPARRPIQVTRDLGSFWHRTYPEVKKELKGRYPKHPWPDDPWSAEPTRKIRR